MNEILIMAFVNRIKAEEMNIEQVPIPYQEKVQEIIEYFND